MQSMKDWFEHGRQLERTCKRISEIGPPGIREPKTRWIHTLDRDMEMGRLSRRISEHRSYKKRRTPMNTRQWDEPRKRILHSRCT